MGITQQIGASSLIKPGVIDNTAARPASPYEGQVVFQKDTDQLLIYTGSAWVSVAATQTTANVSSGLVYVTGGAFSSQTEIIADNVFTSTFRNYRLIFDCQSSAGGGIFAWQLRDAGSTIATTTYNFSAMDISGTSITSRLNSSQSSIRFGANDTSAFHSSTLDIFCPQLALPTRLISAFNRNNANTVENAWATNTNSTSYSGFRISTSTGNMTGFFTLYGYSQ